MKKLIFITLFFIAYSQNSFADNSYFIDFSKVLNKSKPGSEVQKKLKDKFNTESKKFTKLNEGILREEAELISKKKDLSSEEYKKKS